MGNQTILEVTGLRYAYQEGGQTHVVFDDLGFTIEAGERVALVGSSGSGKSTLLNLVGGIDRPAAGEVSMAGAPFSTLAEPALTRFRCQHIGYVYQQFNLIPTLTVAENVTLPLELLGVSRAQRAARCSQWLSAVDLARRGDAFPDQLSGGEQQRVAIARAMIHEPALLLADEPTGNLDARTGARILDLLFDLSGQRQQTLLVVTHSEVVATRADRVLTLVRGCLKAETGGAGC